MKPCELEPNNDEPKLYLGYSDVIRYYRQYRQQECLVAYRKSFMGRVILIRGQKCFFGFVILNKGIRSLNRPEVYRRDLKHIKLLFEEIGMIDKENVLTIIDDTLYKQFERQVLYNSIDTING